MKWEIHRQGSLDVRFPETPYQARYRPTELSLQFLRWIRYHLMRTSCYGPALALLRPLMAQYL